MRFYQPRLQFCPLGLTLPGTHVVTERPGRRRQQEHHPTSQKEDSRVDQIGIHILRTHAHPAYAPRSSNSILPVKLLYRSTTSLTAYNRPSDVNCLSASACSICDIQYSTARSTPHAISSAITSTISRGTAVAVATTS